MEIRLLKKLFEEGLLLAATALPAPMNPGHYLLVFSKSTGGEECVTRTRDHAIKTYKRLSGALIDAQEIGFKEVKVIFD